MKLTKITGFLWAMFLMLGAKVQAQTESVLRYELVTLADTQIVEFRTSTLGSLMVWGKKLSDSTFVPSASILLKADEQQKLWKLDYGRKFFSPILLSDFPLFTDERDFVLQKDEFVKGERRMIFNGEAGQLELFIDTSLAAPPHFHDFFAWHFPLWKSSGVKVPGGLSGRGVPAGFRQSPRERGSWPAKTIRLLGCFRRDALPEFYLISGDWIQTGIPVGNTPGSPIQIAPEEENGK